MSNSFQDIRPSKTRPICCIDRSGIYHSLTQRIIPEEWRWRIIRNLEFIHRSPCTSYSTLKKGNQSTELLLNLLFYNCNIFRSLDDHLLGKIQGITQNNFHLYFVSYMALYVYFIKRKIFLVFHLNPIFTQTQHNGC
jgi:hypothetical protein